MHWSFFWFSKLILEGEDNEFRPPEVELDEYHPKATRTLFVGNLEKDITTQELRDRFKKLGEIIVSIPPVVIRAVQVPGSSSSRSLKSYLIFTNGKISWAYI